MTIRDTGITWPLGTQVLHDLKGLWFNMTFRDPGRYTVTCWDTGIRRPLGTHVSYSLL